jgi:hypothetical protein
MHPLKINDLENVLISVEDDTTGSKDRRIELCRKRQIHISDYPD